MNRPQLLTPIVALSWVNAAIVLIMAVLGGRFFVEPDVIDVHGYIGNLFFALVVAQAGLLVMAGIRGWIGKTLMGLAAVGVLLVVAQLGLGYSGRESATALSLHIPNGVLIFGLSAAIVAQLPHLRGAAKSA
jgi:hypothetical protein